MRLACAVLAALLIAGMAVVALTLRTSSTGVVEFGPVDQFAIAGLGVVLASGVMWLGRSRVDADAAGVRVRNLAVTRELPWQAVRAVRFDQKSPWASLLLENDDEVSVLAVQAVDREQAVRAVEGLRRLHAAARANDPKPPPLLYDS
jgi:hypothetical protein